ncbi:hypothetical protein TIFTF001_009937 [Ficus carica]|uniref:Uncharacterized protein n=1 Tax=Ficus carica TaxID=3494 RepID=A0AA88CZD1_FICCA|nr:hypothetical protein TIFTF001_009937 [Ficus carica]
MEETWGSAVRRMETAMNTETAEFATFDWARHGELGSTHEDDGGVSLSPGFHDFGEPRVLKLQWGQRW